MRGELALRGGVALAPMMAMLRAMSVYRCAGCGAFNRVRDQAGRRPVCGRCKAKLDPTGAPQEVSADQLQHAIDNSPVPVLVDFWAPWCGPCRMAAPIVDAIARNHPGTLVVLKVNTDAHPRAASRHGVSGIPLFVMFKNGVERKRQVGLLPRAAFEQWVNGAAAA